MAAKLRYWYRLAKAFIIRFRGILFAGTIIGLLFFIILRFLTPYLFSTKNELVGLTGRYRADTLPVEVLSMIGEGLVNIDASGSPVPGLAISWTTEDEGKVWTFKLDGQKRWHDGSPVRAGDINYEFQDAQIEVIDDQTIKFNLSAPFAPFPVVVSRPVFKRGLLGTGEWKVQNINIANQLVEELVLASQNGSRKTIKFFPSEDATKLAFQLGEIDEIEDLLDPHPFNSWETADISQTIKKDRFVAVFFNTQVDPFKENKPLRQSLSYAVNKQDFGAPRALSPISPDSWAYNPQVKDYAFDTDRAKDLIENVPEEVLAEMTINLTTSPVLLSVAEKVAEAWRELGLTVNVNVVSILPEDYQAFLAIYHIPIDPDQYTIWHSKQTETNISHLDNPRIDALLEAGRLEIDSLERKKIYLDFQRFLLEEAPAVFLYHPISYTVTRK